METVSGLQLIITVSKPSLRKPNDGVAAAVVELDALADAVGPAAEDDDLAGGRSARPRILSRSVQYMYGVNDSNSAAQVSMRL